MHIFIFITLLKISFIRVICDTSSPRGVSDYMSVMLSVFSITYSTCDVNTRSIYSTVCYTDIRCEFNNLDFRCEFSILHFRFQYYRNLPSVPHFKYLILNRQIFKNDHSHSILHFRRSYRDGSSDF